MANHLLPTITSAYANFVTEMKGRFDDLAVGLDPAVTTATNIPTNSIRWSSASNKWQKFNGTAFVDLSALYAINISGNSGSVTNGVYTNATYANPAFITSLAGSKITGGISGNAATATQLATARNINGISFNGTAAISIDTNTSVTFNNSGTGAASGTTFNGGTARTISYNTIGAPSTSGVGATGSWGISITGNAASVTNGVYTTGNQTISGIKTFSNDIVSSGNITAFSDERIKTNWRDLPTDFTEEFAKVKIGVYDRTDNGITQVGVGAQSLMKALPWAVNKGQEGMLSVAYGNAALVAAVTLSREIISLKQQIITMQEQLNSLKG